MDKQFPAITHFSVQASLDECQILHMVRIGIRLISDVEIIVEFPANPLVFGQPFFRYRAVDVESFLVFPKFIISVSQLCTFSGRVRVAVLELRDEFPSSNGGRRLFC